MFPYDTTEECNSETHCLEASHHSASPPLKKLKALQSVESPKRSNCSWKPLVCNATAAGVGDEWDHPIDKVAIDLRQTFLN